MYTLSVLRILMFIPDPDFYPSRLPIFIHPGSNNNKKEKGKKLVLPFFVAIKMTNIKKYFTFE
jgi:hypothetical protein